jgi:hypothetical protein
MTIIKILAAAALATGAVCMTACTQTVPDGWVRQNTTGVFNADRYSSPQAAVSAAEAAGGGTVFFPCGTYIGAIRITTSGITLKGANRNCAILQQPTASIDELTIDATTAGTNGLNYNQVEDLTLRAVSNSTGSGLVIVGVLPTYQPNDWNYFLNVTISGFYNGIDIRGRLIWTKFDHVQSIFSQNNGLNVVTSGVVNTVDFLDSQFAWSQKYGIYWNTSSAPTLSQIINFAEANVQNNQLSSNSTTNCAAAYFNGVNTASFQNSEFESDCPNSTDGNATEVLLTGTYAEAFNFFGDTFNSIINYDITNTTTQTSGYIVGNTFLNFTSNSVKTAITGPASVIEVGSNGGSNPLYIADVSGNDHVIDLVSGKDALHAVASVTDNTISISGLSYVELYYGPYTLNSMTGGYPGQKVTLEARSGGGITISSGSSTGGFFILSGQSITIPLSGKLSFVLASDGMWHPDAAPALAGTTAGIGGAPLGAGQCASGPVTIDGAQPGMAGIAAASDGSYQVGFVVQAQGIADNTATVSVCAIAPGTPAVKTYNVRLVQ